MENQLEQAVAKNVKFQDRMLEAGVSMSEIEITPESIASLVAIEAFDEAGLSFKKVAAVIADAMEATQAVVVRDGPSERIELLPDHNQRLKAAQEYSKIVGLGKGMNIKLVQKDNTKKELIVQMRKPEADTSIGIN